MLAKCREIRNLGEYEGDLHVNDQLVKVSRVGAKLDALGPPAQAE